MCRGRVVSLEERAEVTSSLAGSRVYNLGIRRYGKGFDASSLYLRHAIATMAPGHGKTSPCSGHEVVSGDLPLSIRRS